MATCMNSNEDMIDMTSENGGNSPVHLSISKEKKEKLSELLAEMSKLTDLEKIYMHLKLPPCPVIEDESDSPPSGSASRTSTTLNWIQSHYVEDRRVCLPKQEVYSHYKLYCDSNGINPFVISEFGKIMKTAFPSVHDRRLGQRGKSKYFYGGLRRKLSSGDKSDPDSNKIEDQQVSDHEEELESLSSQLVCEWASCLLGKTFSSVKSLAQYLVFSGASCGKKAALFNMLLDMDGWGSSLTAQDTQALLQRKILQKEVLKEHKSLLKQQETKQNEIQAAHPTAARFAVLSPSLHALHSSDVSNFHSSRLHVLNVARNNSACSVPILPAPLRQEHSEVSTRDVIKRSASVSSIRYTNIIKPNKSKSYSIQDESLDINKNISTSDAHPQTDKDIVKVKQSRLISSKSLEESTQRQPKRNGDFLYNANQGQRSKRRRCITSLGMAGLMEQSSESIEQSCDDQKDSPKARPVSCPVFKDDLQTFVCDMESEDIETISSNQLSETTKPDKEAISVPDINTPPSDDKGGKTSNSDSSLSSSFHFVRKPTVISIKPTTTELNENKNPLHSSDNDPLGVSDNGHVSSEKKTNSIMHSILSSSDSNIPHNFSSVTGKSSSFSQPLCDSQLMDNDKLIKRGAHTLDNAYLLPCQSSRSAFVRVMNGKGHRRSEILPRPRHSSFDSSLDNEHTKQGGSGDKSDVNGTSSHNTLSPGDGNEGIEKTAGDNFKSIVVSSSLNDTMPSTVVDTTTQSQTETTSLTSTASITSCITESLQSVSMQLTSPTITSPVHSKGMTSKSPVTPPKRHQSRSRFTPIRPKISNLSPQKRDMRPVATILKEQRARSAQELLVNLANSYQGGIKVQIPSDLFGVTTDQTANPTPSVLGALGNQNIPCPTAVILEPVSINQPITTQASPLVSPHKIISTSTVTMTPPMSSTLSSLLTGCPKVSETISVSDPTKQPRNVTLSSTIITPTHSMPAQSLESPVAFANSKGAGINCVNMGTGKPVTKVSSLQQLLQGNTDQIKPPSTLMQQNVINISDIKGHVLGQDACGQKYLLVPNSESTTIPLNHTPQGTCSSSLGTLSSPKQRHSLVSKLTTSVSSSALLSELSQLASVSNGAGPRQPVIKYDSTVSAFQKCEPNKSVTDINNDVNSQMKTTKENRKAESIAQKSPMKGDTSDVGSMSCDEMSDSHEMDVDACLRKRKASKGQDDKLNEKKRHNTDDIECDDVVFVKDDDNIVRRKESKETVQEEKTLTPIETRDICSGKLKDESDITDTEALLDLIDSRSMTVKQTVMAMNSLKAQMKRSGLSMPSAKTIHGDSSVKVDSLENAEKSAQRTLHHAVRRNASLNLESLESDALLDTELFLDNHLVEDIKQTKNEKSDLKTSVAVAAKSQRSHSLEKQKDHRRGKDHKHLPTISPKALRSYQIILNEKSKSFQDRKSDQEASVNVWNPVVRPSKECRHREDSSLAEKKTQRMMQRRCVSSVQDILQAGSRPLPPPFEQQSNKSQSEADIFDALLSKMYSKQLPSSKDYITRSHSLLKQGSELPGDILDFVTESMSSRKDGSEGSSKFKPFKPPESNVTRSISVPNTKPDFFDAEESRVNLVSSGCQNVSSFRTETSQLFIQPATADSMASGEEIGTTKNVFLSPIGPAKLARRSSVEKSFAQGQVDRPNSRTPAEMSSPTSLSQSILSKEKFTTEASANASGKVHRTKTPVDRNLTKHRSQTPSVQSVEKGYKSPVNRAMAQTPIDKSFVKQSSDPLPPRSDLMLPILSSVRREDASSVHTFVSDGGYTSGSVSQTPNSDCGRSSVSQTPISDFGYSSVSPSPVMMSSTAYLGESGRNVSPATIFMPLRSDSALSVNITNPRCESPSNLTANQIEFLRGFSNNLQRDRTSTIGSNDTLTEKDKKVDDNQAHFTEILDTLGSKALLLNDMEGKEDSKMIKNCSNTNTLLKLLTSSIQNIPTPPVSPSASPPNNLPLPFSIASPQLPCPGTSPLQLPMSTAPYSIPPPSSLSSSSSSNTYTQQGRHFGPSPHFRSQELPSPALVTHSYTPSPQILARPPSSPHQYSSHPSPPFTPCSLRSLQSPRCMTPISHKSLISPRSVTPSSDPSQAAPNRFMPIQSSGVLPISQTSTHTYIQPIRPVVALASASSGHNNNANNNFSTSSSILQSTMSRSLLALPTPQNRLDNPGLTTPGLQAIPSLSQSHSNSLSQSLQQGMDQSDAIRTSEHKPLESNSTLILSLSGGIESPSKQGADSVLGNAESPPQHQQKTVSNQISIAGKQTNKGTGNRIQSQISQKPMLIKPHSSTSTSLSYIQSHYPKPRDSSSSSSSTVSSSILKLPAPQPYPPVPNDGSRPLINSLSSPSRAFKPPLSLSSPSSSSSLSSTTIGSFRPVSTSSSVSRLSDFTKLDSGQSQHPPHNSDGPAQLLQTPQACVDRVLYTNNNNNKNNNNNNPTQHPLHKPSHGPWGANSNSNANACYQPFENPVGRNGNSQTGRSDSLNATTQDELQATLDVLKDMDSQYFL